MRSRDKYLVLLSGILLIMVLALANAHTAWAQAGETPEQLTTDPSPSVGYELEEQEWYDPTDWFEPGEYELEREYGDDWYENFGTQDYTFDYFGGVVREYGAEEGEYGYDYYTEDWYEDDWDLW